MGLAKIDVPDWQNSYEMRPTTINTDDGSKVYYIDIDENITSILFNNGKNLGQNLRMMNYHQIMAKLIKQMQLTYKVMIPVKL